jgi:hypothetical protein
MLQGVVFKNLREAGWGRLTHLTVEIPCFSVIDMTGVGQLTNLRHLTVRHDFCPWGEVYPLHFSALCGLEQLCTLEVEGIDRILPPPRGHALHHVTHISVRCSGLRDWELQHLVLWSPQLEVLSVECCPLLTAVRLIKAVTASPTLRALNIIHVGPR